MGARALATIVFAFALSAGCQVGFVDGDGGNGGGGDPANAPTLEELTTEAEFDRWRLAVGFRWSDPQSNVREGVFRVYVGGALFDEIDLPDNRVTLFSDVGEAKIDLTPFLGNEPVELGLVLVDTDGNESATLAGDVDLGWQFVDEVEPNEAADPGSAQNLGALELPGAILGDLSVLDADGFGNYTGDRDWYVIRPTASAPVELSLYWPEHVSDMGFLLQKLAGPGDVIDVINMDDKTLIPPEYGEATFEAGGTYFLRIAGADGEPMDYVMLFD